MAAARAFDASAVRFGPDGLVAAVVQDADEGRVLMVAWQDAEAIEATIRTGDAHFHSRSRGRLWRKGESSGNTLAVVSLELDCDADAILIRARPAGPTCHTGARSCFDAASPDAAGEAASRGDAVTPPDDGTAPAALSGGAAAPAGEGAEAASPRSREEAGPAQDFAWLEVLWATVAERARTRPAGSYTSHLLAGGVDAVARKVAEEATEVVMAAKDDAVAERDGAPRPRVELAGELGDLLYHALVLCAERGMPPSAVIETLRSRHAR
jgi:phosphoribosyl-AMP cyclohydrolase / phosphoribosyl-ATP pyrophosphohydrolase